MAKYICSNSVNFKACLTSQGLLKKVICNTPNKIFAILPVEFFDDFNIFGITMLGNKLGFYFMSNLRTLILGGY